MSGRRPVPLSERKYWNRVLAERELSAWRATGLSLSEYGRSRGLHPKRLWRWKRRLEEGGAGQSAMTVVPPPFLPVRVLGLSASPVGSFEVVLDDPVRVRVPADFDAHALRRLLGTLSRC